MDRGLEKSKEFAVLCHKMSLPGAMSRESRHV